MASDWFIARAVFRQASKNAFLLSRAQFHWFIYLHMNFFRNPQTMHATDNILGYGIFFSSFLVMWKRGGERGMHWPGWKYEWRVRELLLNVHRNEKVYSGRGEEDERVSKGSIAGANQEDQDAVVRRHNNKIKAASASGTWVSHTVTVPGTRLARFMSQWKVHSVLAIGLSHVWPANI